MSFEWIVQGDHPQSPTSPKVHSFPHPCTPGLSRTPIVVQSGEVVANCSTPVTATQPKVSVPTTQPGDLGTPVSPGAKPIRTTNHGRQAGMLSTPSSPEVPHTPLNHSAAPPRGSSTGLQRPLPTIESMPKSTDHPVLNPKRLSFGQPNDKTPTPTATRVPRAIVHLQPHNQAGRKEAPLRPSRRGNEGKPCIV
ncbi:merozoite surface protein CMZ-8-like [Dreissena polymorpha]|uniref:Uncharacterized protein n=1 Tax=Dreissena polymorpha TaxID=45954 RepID=A0A9D4L6D9_DREPO|nr:merozoite surface protein CMZ-8-like [Dreissena polymorpha]KAH3852129.1 hypothetical protein DPMN_094627 [Dreissena polymorpha]